MHAPCVRVVARCLSQQNNDPQGKPNEDYLLVDPANGIFIVCDGVTRLPVDGCYPQPSPSAQAAAIFATATHRVLAGGVPAIAPDMTLRTAIAAGNAAVADLNALHGHAIDYLEHDFAGTVAIVGLIAGPALHYAYLGDCAGYTAVVGSARRCTEPQTAHVAQYRTNIGTSRAATLEIRRAIRNHPEHPYGFGVFTGEPAALDFVTCGQLALSPGQTILLASDGLAPLLDRRLAEVYDRLPSEIIALAEQLDVALGLRSDDKTLVSIQILE